MAFEGRVENAFDERGFARSAHTRNDAQHIEWELNIDTLQVVHAATRQSDASVPGPAALRNLNGLRMSEILNRMRTWIFLQQIFVIVGLVVDFGHRALIDDLAPQAPSIRTHIDEPVGGTHDLLVVFHYDDRIAQVAQFFQYFYQAVCISAVEANARLVENVE